MFNQALLFEYPLFFIFDAIFSQINNCCLAMESNLNINSKRYDQIFSTVVGTKSMQIVHCACNMCVKEYFSFSFDEFLDAIT